MATLVLSAVGLAVGGSIGGSVLGLSTAVIGRAVGAAVGRSIDERLLGSGSAPVESGKVDRFRLTGASEGASVAQVHGRMRVGGQVIWATRFAEDITESGGGKGSRSPARRDFSYSVSLALALCEGPITRVGRIWADGEEIAPGDITMRLYKGTDSQGPDPLIEATEGAGTVPAFRGMAYLVVEDLDLGRFGNRVPQFSFEVFRPGAVGAEDKAEDLARLVRAVCLIPGTGEYALATTVVNTTTDFAESAPANVNTPLGQSDFRASVDALVEELPNCGSANLVVCWFGDDLRAGECRLRPKVEQTAVDGDEMPWTVTGLVRADALTVPVLGGGPVYGGTPSDQSVIEAIRHLGDRGQQVVFYPFILMEQLAGNSLPNPYSGQPGQPPLPWRGRITTALAPGLAGTTDQTGAATAEVAAFFGACTPAQFSHDSDGVIYSGPPEWTFRRMILHYAHLCAAAGGVDAFCIGTEMRGLTQIRDATGFPAVAALRTLAAEVKAILPGAKITYAADWSEYHGYQPPGTADKLFHLDPLWADPAIDLIGIDNYLPLSDWRDGQTHADAAWGSIYNLDYLTANVAGGEYFDWFYATPESMAAQIRTPITDGEGEPWIWRAKDIKGWWSHAHHDRIGGVRSPTPTAWEPQSKPIWFTELGCAAIDKGTNEPNKFLDPKSSESVLPRASNGLPDEFIQMQYLRAMHRHFADPVNNPDSSEYAGRMVDMDRAHVWAWDARPFPWFPANATLWSDAANYRRGHWLNGRASSRSLAGVVTEICARAGVTAVQTDRLFGTLRGYQVDDTATARAALQPLMLAFGFDVLEREGLLVFASRDGLPDATLDPDYLAMDAESEATLTRLRAPEAELAGRVRLTFVDADTDYDTRTAEAAFADEPVTTVAGSELPIALTRTEGTRIAERWLSESRLARDRARFALPLSALPLGPGDVVTLDGADWRIDRMEQTDILAVECVRVDAETWRPHAADEDAVPTSVISPATRVQAIFLDLPLIRGDEAEHAPHVAMTGRPWPGTVALQDADDDADYELNTLFPVAATVGTTRNALFRAPAGRWDRGPALRVKLVRGTLETVTERQLLAGRNLMAIGTGTDDVWELFQFAEAELVGPNLYDLRLRLRGQQGTDGVMPADWPVGSRVVLLNGVPKQIDLAAATRGLPRFYRWGPAKRASDDASWRGTERAFEGVALRPWPVAHLTHRTTGGGGVALTWIRRTRIDGDPWGRAEVPLGEATEAYLVRVRVNGTLRRETVTATPDWTWTPTMQAEDGTTAPIALEVAQISDRWGPGPFRGVTL